MQKPVFIWVISVCSPHPRSVAIMSKSGILLTSWWWFWRRCFGAQPSSSPSSSNHSDALLHYTTKYYPPVFTVSVLVLLVIKHFQSQLSYVNSDMWPCNGLVSSSYACDAICCFSPNLRFKEVTFIGDAAGLVVHKHKGKTLVLCTFTTRVFPCVWCRQY